MKTQPQVVSLIYELLDLSRIVAGTRILSELLALGELPDERTDREAPATIGATLAFVQSRLALLASVVAGNKDPALMLTASNAAHGPVQHWEDDDVRLTPWADGQKPPKKPAARGAKRQR